MMIDAPSYRAKDEEEENIKLTDQNKDEIINYINSLT